MYIESFKANHRLSQGFGWQVLKGKAAFPILDLVPTQGITVFLERGTDQEPALNSSSKSLLPWPAMFIHMSLLLALLRCFGVRSWLRYFSTVTQYFSPPSSFISPSLRPPRSMKWQKLFIQGSSTVRGLPPFILHVIWLTLYQYRSKGENETFLLLFVASCLHYCSKWMKIWLLLSVGGPYTKVTTSITEAQNLILHFFQPLCEESCWTIECSYIKLKIHAHSANTYFKCKIQFSESCRHLKFAKCVELLSLYYT